MQYSLRSKWLGLRSVALAMVAALFLLLLRRALSLFLILHLYVWDENARVDWYEL